ncbi:MAG: hypothetical protein AB1449_04470 [Chloroflexota bacterium]
MPIGPVEAPSGQLTFQDEDVVNLLAHYDALILSLEPLAGPAPAAPGPAVFQARLPSEVLARFQHFDAVTRSDPLSASLLTHMQAQAGPMLATWISPYGGSRRGSWPTPSRTPNMS